MPPVCSRPSPLRMALHARTDKALPPPPPSAPAIARELPVIAPNPAPAAGTYPPRSADAAALLHTYSLFTSSVATFAVADALHRAAAPKLCACSACACTTAPMTWTLCVPLPLPALDTPTLRAVEYMIGYSTAHAGGQATVQTDLLVTTHALQAGVFGVGGDRALEALYMKDTESGHAAPSLPRMVLHEEALRLAFNPAVISGGASGEWVRYIDGQRIAPDLRVAPGAGVYLVLHMNEYPTVEILRTLKVYASATWQRKEVEEEARAEEERRARQEKEERARKLAEKKAREEEERRERAEAHAAREEERIARREEREERAAVQRAREEARSKVEADAKQECAPLQVKVEVTVDRAGTSKCPQGYTYHQTVDGGFTCEGGSHKITIGQPKSK